MSEYVWISVVCLLLLVYLLYALLKPEKFSVLSVELKTSKLMMLSSKVSSKTKNSKHTQNRNSNLDLQVSKMTKMKIKSIKTLKTWMTKTESPRNSQVSAGCKRSSAAAKSRFNASSSTGTSTFPENIDASSL